MRDPDRIDPTLDEIAFYWKAYPDLRLTQLLLNTVKDDENAYYLEEDELLERMRELYG